MNCENRTGNASDRSGQARAILHSFVASFESLKLDPFAWFGHVLGLYIARKRI
jgi:hypothetical protein